MRRWIAIAALLLAAPAWAEAPAKESAAQTAERFVGSSLLYENSWSVGHGANLDPVSTKSWSMLWTGTLALQATEHLSFSLGGSMQRFLWEEDTTFRNEVWLSDTTFGLAFAPPGPELEGDAEFPLSANVGLDLDLPTSKASQAETLILAASPYMEGTVTAPLLDGWGWTYRFTMTPRAHRYTTAALATPRVCSQATGCTLGTTTNTGWLNTKLQMTHGISTSISALDEILSLSAGLDVTYGWLYDKSPSERYPESVLSDPGNAGGTPVTLSSAFTLDLTITPNDAFAVSVGLWTPGGMTPSGGWYNPLGNRWSQVYFDVTFYPVGLGKTLAK